MARLEEMPLFPLHTVLFPHAPMHLHVFEDRYRQMVHQCLEFDRPFGICLIKHGGEVGDLAEPFMVGTAVRIEYAHTYDDGRIDLKVIGQHRFRIRKVDDSEPLLKGFVEPVGEGEVENPSRLMALKFRAEELFKIWVKVAFAHQADVNVDVQFPDDAVAVSFLLSNYLQSSNLVKQRLLEITDTSQRFAEIIPLVEQQIMESQHAEFQRLDSSQLADWISPN
jgi:Lon protease-like protein